MHVKGFEGLVVQYLFVKFHLTQLSCDFFLFF